MGRVTVQVTLANYRDKVLVESGQMKPDQARRAQVRGVVDTGAARLVLPKNIVRQLGLPQTDKVSVRYADGRKAMRAVVGDVWLEWQGRSGIFSAIVEPNRSDALIGAIVMEELDFVVDCTKQTVQPRDPRGIIAEIE